MRSYADLSSSHHRVLSAAGQGNSFVKQSQRCHQIRVTIQKQNHKYERRAGVVSPPEAALLTFHPSGLCQPCRWHKRKRRKAGEGKREKDKARVSVRDTGRQGAGGGQVQSAPRGAAPPLKAWKGLLKIYTLARHLNVSNIQTICLKKNKWLPRPKVTEAPWSRPSMFLFTAVFQCRLKIDFITKTFLIKAWVCFLHNRSSSPSSEWRWHNIWDSLSVSPWQGPCQSHGKTQEVKVKVGLQGQRISKNLLWFHSQYELRSDSYE